MKILFKAFTTIILYIFLLQILQAEQTALSGMSSDETCRLTSTSEAVCKKEGKQTTITFATENTLQKLVVLEEGKIYAVDMDGKVYKGKRSTVEFTTPAPLATRQKTQTVAVARSLSVDETPTIKLNDETMIELEKGDKYVDYGATWKDKEDGKGIVLAKNILVKNDAGELQSTGSVNSYRAGELYRLEYFYVDEAGNQSETLTRFVSIVEPTEEVAHAGNHKSCEEVRIVCRENIFGEKTWQLSEGDICSGKKMDKVGKLCEPPKEGKIVEKQREAYYGKDNLKDAKNSQKILDERIPLADKEVPEVYEEELAMTAAPEIDEAFVAKMEQLVDAQVDYEVTDLNKKIVARILNRADPMSYPKKVAYLADVYNDVEADLLTETDPGFKNYLEYFALEIAKKTVKN